MNGEFLSCKYELKYYINHLQNVHWPQVPEASYNKIKLCKTYNKNK